MRRPPDPRMGSLESETVNRRKGICSSMVEPRPSTITSWKTSHGPAKSITVAPSVITNATGMLPFAGGRSFPSREASCGTGRGCASALLHCAAAAASSAMSVHDLMVRSLRWNAPRGTQRWKRRTTASTACAAGARRRIRSESAARRDRFHGALRIAEQVARHLHLDLGGELLRGDAGRAPEDAREVARAHRRDPRQLREDGLLLRI